MLTGTVTRRCAAALLVALVAVLLVATGGTARATSARLTAGTGGGTGHLVASAQPARHVAAVAPHASDHPSLHVDLASTPPAEPASLATSAHPAVPGEATTHVTGDPVAPVGRGPPAP